MAAKFVINPRSRAVAITITSADAPAPRVPSAQDRTPFEKTHPPCEGAEETNAEFVASVSTSCTCVASSGPRLVTVKRYVSGAPASTSFVTAPMSCKSLRACTSKVLPRTPRPAASATPNATDCAAASMVTDEVATPETNVNGVCRNGTATVFEKDALRPGLFVATLRAAKVQSAAVLASVFPRRW